MTDKERVMMDKGIALEVIDVVTELDGISSKLSLQTRFGASGPDAATIGRLQELQHVLDKQPSEHPVVRAALALQGHLASVGSLRREKFSPIAVEAFWNETSRLEREFVQTVLPLIQE